MVVYNSTFSFVLIRSHSFLFSIDASVSSVVLDQLWRVLDPVIPEQFQERVVPTEVIIAPRPTIRNRLDDIAVFDQRQLVRHHHRPIAKLTHPQEAASRHADDDSRVILADGYEREMQ